MTGRGFALAAGGVLALTPGVLALVDQDAVRRYFEREDRRLVLGAGVARASLYWDQLAPIARRAGIEEGRFFAVALAESQFNPHAVSPTGAEGMWQFTPPTGVEYGVPDRGSRFDPVRSAEAAARYLVRLEQRFGDWQLAVAAYNLGPTALATTLRRTGAGSWSMVRRHVRAETRDYVPKIEWLAEEIYPAFIRGEARDWGVRVVLGESGDTWFGLARRYGCELAELRVLNRGELRAGTPVALPPRRHLLAEGESLATVAASAGVGVLELQAANHGWEDLATTGATIRVPVLPQLRPGVEGLR